MESLELHIKLIGAFSCTLNGEPLPIKMLGAKQIFVFLALARDHTVERDSLAATLWPHNNKANVNFRQALFHLRKNTSNENINLIGSNRSLVKLNASRIILDTEQLIEDISKGVCVPDPAQLMNLSGQLLQGFEGQNDDLGDWIQMVRADFENRIERAIRDLLNSAHSDKIRLGAAQCALSIDATNELACRTAMQILHSIGETAKAIGVYSKLYRSLEDEFDLEPAKETQELAVKIKLDEKSSSIDNPSPDHIVDRAFPLQNFTAVPQDAGNTGVEHRFATHKSLELLDHKIHRPILLIDALDFINYTGIKIETLNNTLAESIEESDTGRVSSYSYGEYLLSFDNIPKAVEFAFSVQRLFHRFKSTNEPVTSAWPKLAMVDTGQSTENSLTVLRALSGLAGHSEIIVNSAIADFLTHGIDASFEDIGNYTPPGDTTIVRALKMKPPAQMVWQGRTPQTHHAIAKIAVIPFRSDGLRSDPSGLIGDVLADELNSQITLASNMTAISRLSARVFSNRVCSVHQIASSLNCDYVISGYCSEHSGVLYWTVELAAGETEEALWSAQLQLQNYKQAESRTELCMNVLREVWRAIGKLAENKIRREQIYHLDSHLLHTAAINLMQRMRKRDFLLARQALNVLIERDHGFAPAHAALATWRVMRAQQGWMDNAKREMELATNTVSTALDLNPDCSAALVAYGDVQLHFFGNLDIAHQSYKDAIEADRNNGAAWLSKAALSAFTDDGSSAVSEAQKAIEISPLDPASFLYKSIAASAYLSAGDNSKALEYGRESLILNKLHASSLRVMILANWRQANFKEARSLVSKLIASNPDFTIKKYTEYLPAYAGKTITEAICIFKKLGIPA